METKVRVQLSLDPKMVEKLDALRSGKGLTRSALIAVILDEKWKEEMGDGR